MIASVIVWDKQSEPPEESLAEVLRWRSYAGQDSFSSSVPRYLEDHAERFRAKYLAFIHDLGESRINGKRVVEHLDLGDGFSFWWMNLLVEKSPLKSPRIYDCLLLMALEEILLQKMPFNVTFVSADRDLARAILSLCAKMKIGFVWQQEKRPNPANYLRKLYHALPNPLQGIVCFTKYLITRRPFRKLQAPQWFSGENSVFFCSSFVHLSETACAAGHYHSRMWEGLPQLIHDRGGRTNWIQHFLISPAVPDTQTGVDWLRLFNRDAAKQGCHCFLDIFLTWKSISRTVMKWFRINIASWRLRKISSAFFVRDSAVWLWPLLCHDWRSSLVGPAAILNCMRMELFDAAFQEMPHQNLGLYLWENQDWERALLWAWRRHGHGRIIGVQHATVPFWHLYNFDDPRTLTSEQPCAMPLPDQVAVNGPMAWNALIAAGHPTKHLVQVEALRYLYLAELSAKGVRPAPEGSAPQRTGMKVLIVGDMIPASMSCMLNLLEASLKLLSTGCRFTLKPHPAYAIDPNDFPALNLEVTTESLGRIFYQFDAVYAAYSTSAALDAFLAGLPVLIPLDGSDFNLSPLRGHPDVSFVTKPEDLAEALHAAETFSSGTQRNNDFFYLERELPRWKRLLKFQ